jgi:hypothetical protein
MSNTKRKGYALRHDSKPWTATDLLKLRGYAKEGLSARQAAEKLGRSTGAVKFKAMVERVRFRAINQPRGTQRRPEQRALLSRLATRRHRAARRAA